MIQILWGLLLLPLGVFGQQTVPESSTYNQALGLHTRGQFRQAFALLAPALASDSARPTWFRLAGNCWDAQQRPDSAMAYYKRGLLRFPKSGALHWEIGRQFVLKDETETALGFWNLGILAEPSFPNNYFQAGRAYSRTTTPIWALVYYEIYLNLASSSSDRSEAARVLLLQHRQAIVFPTDSTALVKLTDQNQVYLAADDSSLIIPLPLALQLGYHAAVGQVLLPRLGTLRTAPLTLLELAAVRQFVVDNWATQGRDTTAANWLYHRHKALIAAGLWDAYHIWLMGEANTEAQQSAAIWKEQYPELYAQLNVWLAEHPAQLPQRTVLCGMLYE
jgi:tetratricopeptide (TPR) repeat protein